MSADLTITVGRSGGFAGLTREWSVSSTLDSADDLMQLIEACPWRSVQSESESRDRFVYVITVRTPRTHRSATVPESSLTGPWKSLVQRVQNEHPSPESPGTPPAAR